ncbi:MAG: hypothetical protein HQL72_07010 [Magnetococcales bacterium]|nr:hypothetical protein [Magnetococcales bacterium]
MLQKNCWQFKGCGFGPDSERCRGGDSCPAATLRSADGFLGGANGGRCCYFIAGTLCGGSKSLSLEEKQQQCIGCSFFGTLVAKHGKAFTQHNYERYISNSENRVLF